jgi:hypothetical protein
VRAGFVIYVVGYLLVGRPLRRPRDLPSVLGVRIAVARRSTLQGGKLSVGDSHSLKRLAAVLGSASSGSAG